MYEEGGRESQGIAGKVRNDEREQGRRMTGLAHQVVQHENRTAFAVSFSFSFSFVRLQVSWHHVNV